MKSRHLIGWTLSRWPSLFRDTDWDADIDRSKTVIRLVLLVYTRILDRSISARDKFIYIYIVCVRFCYWYGGQYQDRQTALESWYRACNLIFHSPPARAISFPLVSTITLGRSVYPDIALHISNYYISIQLFHAVLFGEKQNDLNPFYIHSASWYFANHLDSTPILLYTLKSN